MFVALLKISCAGESLNNTHKNLKFRLRISKPKCTIRELHQHMKATSTSAAMYYNCY